jgi:hypothetical protein
MSLRPICFSNIIKAPIFCLEREALQEYTK